MALDNQNGQDTGLYTYDSFGEPSRPREKKFLWWCAGAHQELLRQFESEQTKYSALGGVLLATFVLASLAAGYAVYTVFDNVLYGLLFGVIWGLIIFNFDRFLVSTMRKYGVSKRRQVWMAVPRMVLALLIGLTIARPLELKIFEKEVNVKMADNLHRKIGRNDSLLTLENAALVTRATAERDRLTARKLAIESQLHNLQNSYVQEADGTGGSGERGIEDLTKLKMDAYTQARTQSSRELADLERGIAAQDTILSRANEDLEQRRKDYETAARNNLGFLERNKALADLSHEENSVFWSCLLISMLIILIEIGPVLSKLIMPIGPYDIALAKEELIRMAMDENHIRADKEISHQKKKMFYEKQKQMSDELVEKLTGLQKKHIDKELDQWERGEWEPEHHRASMDEVMRKIKKQYQFRDDTLL